MFLGARPASETQQNYLGRITTYPPASLGRTVICLRRGNN